MRPNSILIVEDTPGNAAKIGTTLRRAGYDAPVLANSFEVARDYLAAGHFSLLITKLRLGAFNGLHLVVQGRARYPDLAAIVLATTPDVGNETDAVRAGAIYLVEPVSPDVLLSEVTRALATV